MQPKFIKTVDQVFRFLIIYEQEPGIEYFYRLQISLGVFRIESSYADQNRSTFLDFLVRTARFT